MAKDLKKHQEQFEEDWRIRRFASNNAASNRLTRGLRAPSAPPLYLIFILAIMFIFALFAAQTAQV